MNLKIKLFNEQAHKIDILQIKRLAQKVWQNESEVDAKLNIVFVNDEQIKRLNRKYFRKETTTDVIAFPLSEDAKEFFEGEVYICVNQVFKNAGFYQVSQEAELKRVVAHGILHLAGYRDKTAPEKQLMTMKENHYLERGE